MYQRKSDGKWCETTYVGGKRKVIYGKTKAELKKKLLALNAASTDGPLLTDAVDEWLKYKEKLVAYKTYEGYQAPVARIKNTFEGQLAKDVTPSQVQAMVNQLALVYKRTTVQRPLDILNMVYNYLITQPGSVITFNPTTAVKIPSGLKQEHRDLAAADDIERIKAGVDLPFGLFAYFLLYTGMRKGEALALTDKDFVDGYIQVGKSVSWQTNQPVIKEPKTENGVRSVILLSPLEEHLPKWKGYLFSADGGKTPLTQIEFRRRWQGYCKAAGLCDVTYEEHTNPNNKHTYTKTIYTPRVVPHQLRHEFATMCFDAGLDEIDTKEIMGHADISTTHAVYQHIKESRRQKSTAKLQEFVSAT